MTATSFDPFRAEHALRWRNRISQWRADAGQTALHLVAFAALAALLALPLLRAATQLAEPAQQALARWPLWLCAVGVLAFAWQQARTRHALAQRDADGWWIAQPITPRVHRRRRRQAQARVALLQLAVTATLLGLLQVTWAAYPALLAIVAVASALAPAWSRRIARRELRAEQLGSRLRDAGVGRVWRWQRIETGVALRGRALAFGFWALLLVPIGSGPVLVLVVLGAGLTVAMLMTAWQRALAVLPQLQAWLAPQPRRGSDWLRAAIALPATILALALSLLAALLLALGTPGFALAAVAAIGAVGTLQFACVFAWRAQPHRIALQLTLQLAVLFAVVQAVAPLALPVWIAQLAWLLRRGRRA
jgi:hypothetical protein